MVLAGAMAFAVVLVLWWSGDRIFAIDEWEYFVLRGEWTLDNLFRPVNGHLLAVPLVVYKGLLSAFGGESHLPFTLLTIALQLLVAGLVFAIAVRRLHPWLALIPAVLILLYGSGWEVLINTAAMQNQFGIAAGLGMILCLDRRRDALAALLLAVSLASFTIGLAFAAGAVVRILLDTDGVGRERLRRIWIVAVPVLLYAIWFAWARKYDQGAGSLHSLGVIVSAIFDQLSAITSGLTGLFADTGPEGSGSGVLETTSRTGALVFVLIAAVAFRFARPPRLSPAAWGALATLVAYLVLIGFGLGEARSPESSRYVYMGSLLLLVAGIELVSGLPLARPWVLAVCAVAVLSIYSNLAQIYPTGGFFEDESEANGAELAALELARPVVDPGFVLETESTPTSHVDLFFPAGLYFEAADRFGSPAKSEEELAAASGPAREAADDLLIRALPVGLGPVTGKPSATAEPVGPVQVLNGALLERGPCVLVRRTEAGPAYASLQVPAAGLDLSAPEGLSLGMRRFGDDFTQGVSTGTSSVALRIPTDLSERPWFASVEVAGQARICPAGDEG